MKTKHRSKTYPKDKNKYPVKLTPEETSVPEDTTPVFVKKAVEDENKKMRAVKSISE